MILEAGKIRSLSLKTCDQLKRPAARFANTQIDLSHGITGTVGHDLRSVAAISTPPDILNEYPVLSLSGHFFLNAAQSATAARPAPMASVELLTVVPNSDVEPLHQLVDVVAAVPPSPNCLPQRPPKPMEWN